MDFIFDQEDWSLIKSLQSSPQLYFFSILFPLVAREWLP